MIAQGPAFIVEGIITLSDIFERMFGETIHDETDVLGSNCNPA